jgi:hypothetical protein
MNETYEVTPGRVVAALLAGPFIGAIVTSLTFTGTGLVRAFNHPEAWDGLLGVLVGAALISFWIYAAGLAITAAPLWWLLHRAGRRTPLHAVLLGFALASAIYLLLFLAPSFWHGFSDTMDIWMSIVGSAGITGLAGAITGTAIWRIAYRRVRLNSDTDLESAHANAGGTR